MGDSPVMISRPLLVMVSKPRRWRELPKHTHYPMVWDVPGCEACGNHTTQRATQA